MVVYQFGFNTATHEFLSGLPLDKVVDCRRIKNPFRPGVADAVLIAEVRTSPAFEDCVVAGQGLLKHHGEVYVGCGYGKHRSAAVAEEIAYRTGAKVVRAKKRGY